MDPDYPARIKEEVEGKERICRLCACSTQLIIPIFDGEGLENNLPEKFDKHLPIQIAPHDTLPVQVCFQCASTVLSWHELTMTCVKAEKKLIAMFGANQVLSTDPQLSPADSRGDDAVICDDSITSLKEQENVGIQPETVEIMHEPESLIEDQDIREEGVHSSEPQEGDHTRFIAEFSEENGEDVVCVEVKESIKSVPSSELKPETDHSYTMEPQIILTEPRSVLRGTQRHCRPILPRPCLEKINKSVKPITSVKTMFQSVNQSAVKGVKCRPILPRPSLNSPAHVTLVGGSSRNPKVVQLPSRGSGSGSQQSQIYLVCSKAGNEQNCRPKPFLVPMKPLGITNKPTNVDTSLHIPKFRDVTITKVPANSSPKKSVKKLPQVSVTIARKPGTSFACTLCGQLFVLDVLRKRHMYLKHGVKQFSCSVCKKYFGKREELRIHVRLSHNKLNSLHPLKYTCAACKEQFTKACDLKAHVQSKHARPPASRFYVSKAIEDRKVIAGVALTDKEVEWVKDFHSRVDEKDVFYCKICQRNWATLEKAVVHIRTHLKEQLYSCDTCGQKFNTRNVLVRHEQVHKNIKPFACEYCDKRFSSKQNRDDHHRYHTKEVKTVCESCGEFLTSASMLYYHRKIHSGINPYKCPYCEKAYSIRALLKRHIRFHTGEKPHLCSVCGRGFNTSGQLRGHSAVHSDARPFSCTGCGSLFKTTKYLNRHKAICGRLRSKETD